MTFSRLLLLLATATSATLVATALRSRHTALSSVAERATRFVPTVPSGGTASVPSASQSTGSTPSDPSDNSTPTPTSTPTPISSYPNSGRATPTASLQTFFWAATHAQSQSIDDSFDTAAISRAKLTALWTQLTDEERAIAGRPERLITLSLVDEFISEIASIEIVDVSPTPANDINLWRHADAMHKAFGPAAEFAFVNVRYDSPPQPLDNSIKHGTGNLRMRQVGPDWKLVLLDDDLPSLDSLHRLLAK